MNLDMKTMVRHETTPDLKGRRYLLTGATGGIGEAVARAITAAGGQVVLLGRKVEALEALADALEATGGEPLLYPMDLSGASVDDYDALADTLSNQLGGLDGVVLCSWSGGTLRPFAQLDPERWARDTQVNLHAPALLLRSLWPMLGRSAQARVLFSLDNLAEVTTANWAHHSVLQWAQTGLMKTLAGEGRHLGVDVFGVYPGPRRTTLRARLYGGELPTEVNEPGPAAAGYVQLLASQGHHPESGQILDLSNWH